MTVDELMIGYSVEYCAIRQYLPAKPIRFGICFVDTRARYVYDFDVYTGKEGIMFSTVVGPVADEGQGHKVMMKLMEGMYRLAQIVSMDNFFTPMKLCISYLLGPMVLEPFKRDGRACPVRCVQRILAR